MKTYKHIGKVKNTGTKCLVVFRTLPGESNMSLILPTATLPDSYHNSIMELVETEQAQDCFEFAEIMFVRYFPDGRPMLRALQADNRLIKMPTDSIIMTPGPQSEIELSQLNVLIAEQRNCTIDELINFVKGGPTGFEPTVNLGSTSVSASAPAPTPAAENAGVLTDTDLAKTYRSQADAMYKEAARMRKEADSIDPPKKKSINPTDA